MPSDRQLVSQVHGADWTARTCSCRTGVVSDQPAAVHQFGEKRGDVRPCRRIDQIYIVKAMRCSRLGQNLAHRFDKRFVQYCPSGSSTAVPLDAKRYLISSRGRTSTRRTLCRQALFPFNKTSN